MKNLKKIGLYLSLLLVIVTIVGCSPKKNVDKDLIDIEDVQDIDVAYPIEIEDNFGNKEIIEKEPMRIVSLAPSNTEMLFALGLGDKVIGVTSNCNYPQEATTKEIVGGYEANLEKIVELDPDLVLVYGPGDEGEVKLLRDAGINVLGFMPETIDAVIADIKTIGKITGTSNAADILTKDMINKRDEIIDAVKGKEKVKVFYEIWHDPLMAAGKGSFMDELITMAGGENIAEDADGAYPEYDLEQLVERDPEVYLTSEDTPEKTVESIKIRPGFENISAIKNDRIYIFKEAEADVVSRPGPRIIEALELVAKSIYPELFK
jgi:iron complex transport system substrate-binding protein